MTSDPIGVLNAALTGRYSIERELGEGGMATVYLAEDLKHHRKVALKVLKPELAAVVGAERFLAEIETTAKLQHPHILPLFDSGEAGGFLFYVMPYVEGESLRQRLDREKQLPVDEAVRIAAGVAEALDYAHRHGVVHRDVKPANVLLHDGEPVVSDFGIALAVGTAGTERLTQTGASMGTPHYMSPEQATGDGAIGPATDTYALGCVLYEMLVGEPPYTGSTPQAVLGKVVKGEPTHASAQRPSVPPSVDAAIARALESIPADRFATSRAFADALVDPSFRHRDLVGPVVSRWSGKRRAAVAAAGVAILLLGSAWALMRADGTADVSASDPSVAVLPCENLSADPEQRYFSDGVADQILNALTRVPELKVTARTSAFVFRDSDLDIRTIADSLGVATVLECTVQRSGERVRITAQLIEAESGFNLWSETYDRDLSDVFEVQDDVARRVAEQLEAELAGLEGRRLAGPPTGSREAHDHYLRGRQLLYRRTEDGIRGAVTAFRQAVEADPYYAPAHAELALAYGMGAIFSVVGGNASYVWLGRSLAHVDRAIELDPENADAYAARVWTTIGPPSLDDFESAERDAVRALEIRPNMADAHGWHGLVLSRQNRHEEALAAHRRAIELDPIAPGRRLGYWYGALAARRPGLALEQIERARQIQPGLVGAATTYEALALLLLDRASECLEVQGLPPAYEAMCLHSLGRQNEAEALITSVSSAWDPSSPDLVTSGLVHYYAWTGQVDEALRWMERGLETTGMVTAITGAALLVMPPGIWQPVLAEDEERIRAAIDRSAREVWDRIRAEREGAALP